LSVDFGAVREFGGLVLEWGEVAPHAYEVLASLDGKQFSRIAEVEGSNGGRDYIRTPDTAAGFLRIRWQRIGKDRPPTLAHLRVMPLTFGDSNNEMFKVVAS